MKKITVFSWGFRGWGNHAAEFVRIVDRVEASRGFRPPIFVDVRIRRTGRAINFKEHAFQDIVGEKRYQWLRGLGNAAIVDKSLNRITIKDPSQADVLLDLVIESAKDKRRVIFYCACEFPGQCHRNKVGTLLLNAARKRGVTLDVVEWPGGKPVFIKEQTSDELLLKFAKSLQNYPLPKNADLKKYGALPWGSIVTLVGDKYNCPFVSGPAKYQSGGWALPGMMWPGPKDSNAALMKRFESATKKTFLSRTTKTKK